MMAMAAGRPIIPGRSSMASITPPIKLAENFRAVFYAPFYAAEALGFFAREGIDVALIDSATPGDAVSGVLDGTIDVTWGGPMRVMKAQDTDPRSPLVCFCEVVARDPFFLVGLGSRAPFKLADLLRLRVATVSEVPTPWMCLQHDLREQGIDPARLDRMPARPMAENIAALRRGEVDVVQVFEPYVSMALAEGLGEVLYAASARGPTVYTTFIATRDALARHREDFAAMTRAIGHVQDWLAEHGAEDLAAAVAPFFPDLPGDILAHALARYRAAALWARMPAVSRQGFARLADSLLSGGFIARTPIYEDCVDVSGLGG
jgi:NitT/TauT family transport system substrate-binding protein